MQRADQHLSSIVALEHVDGDTLPETTAATVAVSPGGCTNGRQPECRAGQRFHTVEDSVLVLRTSVGSTSGCLQRRRLRDLGARPLGVRLGLLVLGDSTVAADRCQMVHHHAAHPGVREIAQQAVRADQRW